ncbi:ArsR/SmtB family transcription factor [Nakamurella flava]|uniref:ArsR/SmtB family transcription factor n=1 Tax=Nakamurella flava TaxID=2576308 RepID=UPI001407C63F|nr:helix-turn-helix domain-containing protein [Nakamurella flava]
MGSTSDDEAPDDAVVVLADPTARRVLEGLRSRPTTAPSLAAYLDLTEPQVQGQLDRLVAAGLVVTERPRVPTGPTEYRWDGGALTGIRALGRRLRRGPGPGTPAGTASPAGQGSLSTPGRRRTPSVAAWTNPAVAAALRRLDEQAAARQQEGSADGPSR